MYPIILYLLSQGTKGLTMFYLQTRNEDGMLNNIEVQVSTLKYV